MELILSLLSSLYIKGSEGSVCDYDVARCPKRAARKLKELSWESITRTEDLKRRGSRRGRFGAQSVGAVSWGVPLVNRCKKTTDHQSRALYGDTSYDSVSAVPSRPVIAGIDSSCPYSPNWE